MRRGSGQIEPFERYLRMGYYLAAVLKKSTIAPTMSTDLNNPISCALYPALKYEVEVRDQGWVEFTVPFAPGARVVIFVIQESDDLAIDLVAAAQSRLEFWDNPRDDKDWNLA